MCGRYTLIETDNLVERFKSKNTLDGLKPNYNVAPSHVMPVVVADGQENELKLMKWGLVPTWAKDTNIGFRMINARAEGIEAKPSFRHAYKKQRCIVPASGFYEWQKSDSIKVPHYIKIKDEPLFGFAGLWEYWKQPNGEGLETYTIITTEPNALMKPIHDRMPVILNKDDEDEWLNPDQQDADFLRRYLRSYPESEMSEYVVGGEVGSVKNNDESLIKEI